MTTRKQKTLAVASKKRTPTAAKPVKAASAPKKAAVAKEKERSKVVLAPKKAAAEAQAANPQVAAKPVAAKAPPMDGKPAAALEAKSGAKSATDKKQPLGIERRATAMPEDRQSQLKLLIARGKEQGYLTYAQVNDHLPSEIVDPEQIEDIVNTINDMGIPVYEKAPDTEALLSAEPSAPADEEAIEEAAAALAALDAELGRTTDPVRMYMREMGTVELLT